MSYRVTLSLLPFTPVCPYPIVTFLENDKVVFPRPLRPLEIVTILVTSGGIRDGYSSMTFEYLHGYFCKKSLKYDIFPEN